MPNKNLTDSEITIKALKEVLEVMLSEGDLQRISTISHTIDLISRQKEEIERLKPFEDKISEFNSHIRVENMLVFANSLEEWLEFCDYLKAEAYKEFAEKLKEKAKPHYFDNYDFAVSIENIDNLLKEMVGEDK